MRLLNLLGHSVQNKQQGKNNTTGEDGRQVAKGQTYTDLVPVFKRVDQSGHGGCIPTGELIRIDSVTSSESQRMRLLASISIIREDQVCGPRTSDECWIRNEWTCFNKLNKS